jgi:hypothetical protein
MADTHPQMMAPAGTPSGLSGATIVVLELGRCRVAAVWC